MSRTICDGLQVIEMGSGSIAASFAGMLLADNGARVVKVEPPDGRPPAPRDPVGFLVWNRGKESLVADLRTPRPGAAVAGWPRARRRRDRGVRARESPTVGPRLRQSAPTNPAPRALLRSPASARTGPYARLPGLRGRRRGQGRPLRARALRLPRRARSSTTRPWGSIGAGHQAVRRHPRRPHRRETNRPRPARRRHAWSTGISALDYFGTMPWQHAQRQTGDAAGSVRRLAPGHGRQPDQLRGWPPRTAA